MVAWETGWRGRELRSGGDSLGGGEITAASREPLGLCTGVLRAVEEPVGVFERVTGVFARDEGVFCCLDVLPPGGILRCPAGEFDRVEAGLAGFDAVPNFLFKTGSREEEECGDGDGSRRFRTCELVLIGASLDMARSLCDLPWFLGGLGAWLCVPFF